MRKKAEIVLRWKSKRTIEDALLNAWNWEMRLVDVAWIASLSDRFAFGFLDYWIDGQ